MRGGWCSQATPRLLAKLWVVTVVLIIFGLLPFGIYELYMGGGAPHVIAWFSAGVFVCLSVPISVRIARVCLLHVALIQRDLMAVVMTWLHDVCVQS